MIFFFFFFGVGDFSKSFFVLLSAALITDLPYMHCVSRKESFLQTRHCSVNTIIQKSTIIITIIVVVVVVVVAVVVINFGTQVNIITPVLERFTSVVCFIENFFFYDNKVSALSY